MLVRFAVHATPPYYVTIADSYVAKIGSLAGLNNVAFGAAAGDDVFLA
jgi:hypothetical protein